MNLRSAPIVHPGTRRASLARGHLVVKLAEAEVPPWWEVRTTVNGATVEGFVHSLHLQPIDEPLPEGAAGVTAVHLSRAAPVRRDEASGRAFPLNEPGQPADAAGTLEGLADIIDWLGVERHERYRPVAGGSTFCNIYAYDYCFLAGAFIPRVWWTSSALARLERGEQVPVSIGNTVVEVNANALSDWFEEHGRTFGWRRTFDLDDLQEAANAGAIGIIVARRAQSNRSGHITAVAPESGSIQAVRKDGAVSAPVQSEAGARNHACGTSTGRWWLRSESGGPKFSRFGFWVYE